MDLIGKVICGYRITRPIGKGGMGEVFLAESAFLKEFKQQVAIKTLMTQSDDRRASLMRDLFEREANIHVQIRHPHIVPVIQFAIEENRAFLLLEFVPGYEVRGNHIGNIADMIQYETGPIPYERALRLFVQALDALSYAHHFRYRWDGEDRVGLVHRDIKPANLLLADPNTLKITDFGIVKVRQAQGVTSATGKLTPGTSAYMSPEAILGADHFGLEELDARSDIYALGVTLFEMLAGRLPFAPDAGKNPDMSLRIKHVEQPPPKPSEFYPGIPAWLDNIVLRALAKHPDQRFQTADEFKQAIIASSGTLLKSTNSTGAAGAATKPVRSAEPEFDPLKTSLGDEAATGAIAKSLQTGGVGVATNVAASTAIADSQKETSGSNRMPLLVIAAVVLLAAAAAGYFFVFKNSPATQPGTQNASPTATIATSSNAHVTPPGMTMITGGSFLMGRNLTDAEKKTRISDNAGNQAEIFSFDYPAHEKTVADFYLDTAEVSSREYARFLSETGHAAPAGWKGNAPPDGAEDIPVTNISYNDAVEFCAWRTKTRNDKLTYRLPSEEEWEFAARGKDAGRANGKLNLYPWGDEWKPNLNNTAESRLNHPQIVTANRNGASSFGILNLSGNVAEWTATDFNHYPGSDKETPREKGYTGTYQVVRGGSYDFPKEWSMTTTRAWARPTVKAPNIGFRCAADAQR